MKPLLPVAAEGLRRVPYLAALDLLNEPPPSIPRGALGRYGGMKKAPPSGAFPVRPRGLEPPRTIQSTRPSTLRVYQFRHRRVGGQYSPAQGVSPAS
jgi:hypothetical protein